MKRVQETCTFFTIYCLTWGPSCWNSASREVVLCLASWSWPHPTRANTSAQCKRHVLHGTCLPLHGRFLLANPFSQIDRRMQRSKIPSCPKFSHASPSTSVRYAKRGNTHRTRSGAAERRELHVLQGNPPTSRSLEQPWQASQNMFKQKSAETSMNSSRISMISRSIHPLRLIASCHAPFRTRTSAALYQYQIWLHSTRVTRHSSQLPTELLSPVQSKFAQLSLRECHQGRERLARPPCVENVNCRQFSCLKSTNKLATAHTQDQQQLEPRVHKFQHR